MKLPLKIESRFFRLGLSLTLVWMAVSIYTYFASLGSHFLIKTSRLTDYISPILWAWWQFSCKNLGFYTPVDILRGEYQSLTSSMTTTVSFRLEGFLGYVFVPTCFIWVVILLAYWVLEEGKKNA